MCSGRGGQAAPPEWHGCPRGCDAVRCLGRATNEEGLPPTATPVRRQALPLGTSQPVVSACRSRAFWTGHHGPGPGNMRQSPHHPAPACVFYPRPMLNKAQSALSCSLTVSAAASTCNCLAFHRVPARPLVRPSNLSTHGRPALCRCCRCPTESRHASCFPAELAGLAFRVLSARYTTAGMKTSCRMTPGRLPTIPAVKG